MQEYKYLLSSILGLKKKVKQLEESGELTEGKNIIIEDKVIDVKLPTPNPPISNILGVTGRFPAGLVQDSLGNIYTINAGSNNISKITPEGISSVFATTGGTPRKIVIDSTGNIYTANESSKNITKVTPSGVSTVFATFSNSFVSVNGFIIDLLDNIYIIINSTLLKVTPEGVVSTITTLFSTPVDLVMDTLGNLYCPIRNFLIINKITPEGVLSNIGTIENDPTTIAIDSQNNLYVPDANSRNIIKVTPSGVSTLFTNTGTQSTPYSIVIDEQNNFYATSILTDTVYKITPDGTIIPLANTGDFPKAIIMGFDRNLYIVNEDSNNVSKITMDSTNKILVVNPTGKIQELEIVDAQDDVTFTKQLVARPDQTIGWEDKVSVPDPPVTGTGTYILQSVDGVLTWVIA